jgi:hypothetical protein
MAVLGPFFAFLVHPSSVNCISSVSLRLSRLICASAMSAIFISHTVRFCVPVWIWNSMGLLIHPDAPMTFDLLSVTFFLKTFSPEITSVGCYCVFQRMRISPPQV